MYNVIIAIAISMSGMNVPQQKIEVVAVMPKEVEIPQLAEVKKSRGKGRFNNAPYFAKYFK